MSNAEEKLFGKNGMEGMEQDPEFLEGGNDPFEPLTPPEPEDLDQVDITESAVSTTPDTPIGSKYNPLVQAEAKLPIKVTIAHNKEVNDYLNKRDNLADAKAQWKEYTDEAYKAADKLTTALQNTNVKDLSVSIEIPYKRTAVRDEEGIPVTREAYGRTYEVKKPVIENGKLVPDTYTAKDGVEKPCVLQAKIPVQVGKSNYTVNVKLGADKDDPMKANGKFYKVSVTTGFSKNTYKTLTTDEINNIPDVKAVYSAANSCIQPSLTKVEKAIANGAYAVVGTKDTASQLTAPKVEIEKDNEKYLVNNVYVKSFSDKYGKNHLSIRTNDSKEASIEFTQSKYGELKATYTDGETRAVKTEKGESVDVQVKKPLDLRSAEQVAAVVAKMSPSAEVQSDVNKVLNSINREFIKTMGAKSIVAETMKAIDNKKYDGKDDKLPEVSTGYNVDYNHGMIKFNQGDEKVVLNIKPTQNGGIVMYYKDDNAKDGKAFIGKDHTLSDFFKNAGVSKQTEEVVVTALKENNILKEKAEQQIDR